MTHETREVDKVVDLIKSYARQYYMTAEENDSEENLKKKEAEIRTSLHHQLQKARQDWLREEIVRLKGIKAELKSKLSTHTTFELEDKMEIIQTIIDRYQEELDQDVSK